MAERERCRNCGGEMPGNAPQGLCPACLLRQGLESQETSRSVDIERTPTLDPDRASTRDPSRSPPQPDAPPADAADAEPRGASQRFRVVRLRGKGGLGEVLLARDDQLNRDVALKRIQERHAADPLGRARFLLEAEITRGLEHPGIVPVHALDQSAKGRPYYIMRFIKGESLKEAIERFHNAQSTVRDPGQRRLELRKLLDRFLDVCNALECRRQATDFRQPVRSR
jgi:serine/threonine protein kinase